MHLKHTWYFETSVQYKCQMTMLWCLLVFRYHYSFLINFFLAIAHLKAVQLNGMHRPRGIMACQPLDKLLLIPFALIKYVCNKQFVTCNRQTICIQPNCQSSFIRKSEFLDGKRIEISYQPRHVVRNKVFEFYEQAKTYLQTASEWHKRR